MGRLLSLERYVPLLLGNDATILLSGLVVNTHCTVRDALVAESKHVVAWRIRILRHQNEQKDSSRRVQRLHWECDIVCYHDVLLAVMLGTCTEGKPE